MNTRYLHFFSIFVSVMLILSCVRKQTNPFSGKIVDLTYAFDEKSVYWPTVQEFQFTTEFEGVTEKGYFYNANSFSAAEHGGTHLDAPYHFNKEGLKLHEIPVEKFMGPGILVDVSSSALENPDYQISVKDFKKWEEQNGRIPEGAIVLVRTGYGKFYPDREKYMGTDARGAKAVDSLHFPGFHPDAAKWIAENRDIRLIGLDAPSIDYGQSEQFRSHRILYKANIPGMENLANLDKLPAMGFQVIALPMKIRDGSGGPTRIVAILNE